MASSTPTPVKNILSVFLRGNLTSKLGGKSGPKSLRQAGLIPGMITSTEDPQSNILVSVPVKQMQDIIKQGSFFTTLLQLQIRNDPIVNVIEIGKKLEVLKHVPRGTHGKPLTGRLPDLFTVLDSKSSSGDGEKKLLSSYPSSTSSSTSSSTESSTQSSTSSSTQSSTQSSTNETILVLPRILRVHPVTDAPEHIDFIKYRPDRKVKVSVPIVLTGVDKCPGVKLGGTLNKFSRDLSIYAPMINLPTKVVIDVSSLGLGDKVSVRHLSLPAGCVPALKDGNVSVVKIKGNMVKAV